MRSASTLSSRRELIRNRTVRSDFALGESSRKQWFFWEKGRIDGFVAGFVFVCLGL